VLDELTLLDGVRRLDPAALEQAHDTYYPVIFRYISFRVGDQETAEDLTSDVFTRLLSSVRDHTAPQNTLRGWLYGVASRVVADYHRKSYRAEIVELTPAIESKTPEPSEAVSNKQTLEALHAAMDDLTEDQQEVIALRFGYEMPIREVAKQMGKSEGAVKQLQARAVAALSRTLNTRSK
jgi:RNA polymerase sigma-70 factor (ECF subfamily)